MGDLIEHLADALDLVGGQAAGNDLKGGGGGVGGVGTFSNNNSNAFGHVSAGEFNLGKAEKSDSKGRRKLKSSWKPPS